MKHNLIPPITVSFPIQNEEPSPPPPPISAKFSGKPSKHQKNPIKKQNSRINQKIHNLKKVEEKNNSKGTILNFLAAAQFTQHQ